jgi:hypothetical protein
MITISNCPITNLPRKVDYDFLWLKSVHQIIIKCTVHYFDAQNNEINTERIKPYQRNLVASDSYVNATNGYVLQEQELSDYLATKNAYDQYQIDITKYNTDILQYQADLSQYQTDFSQYEADYAIWENNPLSERPIMPVAPIEPINPGDEPANVTFPIMKEYDFYAFVIGVTPIVLPNLLESLILSRDLEGKFNI